MVESCAEAFAVADVAKGAGHGVVVVPSMLVRSLGVATAESRTTCGTCGVLFAMWRDGKPYDPKHESRGKTGHSSDSESQTGTSMTATAIST